MITGFGPTLPRKRPFVPMASTKSRKRRHRKITGGNIRAYQGDNRRRRSENRKNGESLARRQKARAPPSEALALCGLSMRSDAPSPFSPIMARPRANRGPDRRLRSAARDRRRVVPIGGQAEDPSSDILGKYASVSVISKCLRNLPVIPRGTGLSSAPRQVRDARRMASSRSRGPHGLPSGRDATDSAGSSPLSGNGLMGHGAMASLSLREAAE